MRILCQCSLQKLHEDFFLRVDLQIAATAVNAGVIKVEERDSISPSVCVCACEFRYTHFWLCPCNVKQSKSERLKSESDFGNS